MSNYIMTFSVQQSEHSYTDKMGLDADNREEAEEEARKRIQTFNNDNMDFREYSLTGVYTIDEYCQKIRGYFGDGDD